MPLYEYDCRKCGNVFEELASVSDTTSPVCPKCGSADTHRLMSACARCGSRGMAEDFSASSSGSGGGCAGCSGGNCASCGH